MEKFSSSARDFIKSIVDEASKDTKKVVTDSLKDESIAIRNAVKASKLIADPTNLPQAVVLYATEKLASVEIKEDISAMDLFDIMMDRYGADWFSWTPETIRKTVLNGQENQIIENKIQAMAVCCKTDTPWLEWHIFENVGKAFNHQVPIFGMLEPLSLGECWVTMETMDYMRNEKWSNEVLIYVATVAYSNNFVYLPENSPLGAAQDHLDGFGTDMDLKMKTSESWSKIEDRDVLGAEFKDTDPVQVQLAKLTVAQQYMKENTEQ